MSSRSTAFDAQFVRMVPRSVHDNEVTGRDEGFDRGPTDGLGADLDDAALYAWLVRMTAGGRDASIVLGGEPVCDTPTVGLCVRSESAVAKVYN